MCNFEGREGIYSLEGEMGFNFFLILSLDQEVKRTLWSGETCSESALIYFADLGSHRLSYQMRHSLTTWKAVNKLSTYSEAYLRMSLIKSKSMYFPLIWNWRYGASLCLELWDKEFNKWCQQGTVLLVWRPKESIWGDTAKLELLFSLYALRNGLVARYSFGVFSRGDCECRVTFFSSSLQLWWTLC